MGVTTVGILVGERVGAVGDLVGVEVGVEVGACVGAFVRVRVSDCVLELGFATVGALVGTPHPGVGPLVVQAYDEICELKAAARFEAG